LSTKESLTGVFSRNAEAYRMRLEESMRKGQAAGRDAILDYLKPRPGMRILDLACGPGTLTYPLAEELNGSGEVVGIDLAEGMLEVAKAGLASRNLPIRFLRMDVEAMQFPLGYFDAAGCGHGLQFIPSLGRALGGIRRVLKPRARFGASVPAPVEPEANPADAALRQAFDKRLGPVPEQAELAATRAIVGDLDRFALTVRQAGFRIAEVERVEVETSWEGPEQFVAISSSWWSHAARLEGLSNHVRGLVLAEATKAVAKAAGTGPLRGVAAANVLRAEA
jgi:ubiquinone/menaquinone biosynthesis C-methylase UbiE